MEVTIDNRKKRRSEYPRTGLEPAMLFQGFVFATQTRANQLKTESLKAKKTSKSQQKQNQLNLEPLSRSKNFNSRRQNPW